MKLRRVIASVGLVGVFLCLGAPASAARLYGKVIEIVDGDTIRMISLNRVVRIKVLAIDAPEMKQFCGDVAKQHLLDLIGEKMVSVEYFGLSEDGSITGKVFLDEMDIGAQMVRDGAAWFDKSRAGRLSATEQKLYADSEAAARNEHRGIWQVIDPTAPWDFRQGRSISAPVVAASNESASSNPVKSTSKSLTNDELGLDRLIQVGRPMGTSDQNSAGDRVDSVIAQQLFKEGPTKVSRVEALPSRALPSGYDFYEAYDIHSEAIAVGHDISFHVASATDPAVFASLRVLHLERDDMDPARDLWVDCTVLEPNRLAPAFETKTLRATTKHLGQFVIAKIDALSIKNALIDLSLTTTVSPERVASGEVVRYLITVQNTSHSLATDVMLNKIIDMRLRLVSATSSQGACKRSPRSDDTMICELNNIAPGGSVIVTIETRLAEGGPIEALKLNHIAMVRARERQAHSPNPEGVISTTVRLAQ
jgi:uncharacterized repeat protein (TIGR01451 family)